MISQRKALNELRHALKKNLLELQERIIRVDRFNKDAIGYPAVAEFETKSLSDLLEQHAQKVAEIRELDVFAQRASDDSMAAFVREVKRRNET
jgi:hypothetical protein